MSSHVSYTAISDLCAISASDVYPRTTDSSDLSRAAWWKKNVIPAIEAATVEIDAEIKRREELLRKIVKYDPAIAVCRINEAGALDSPHHFPCAFPIGPVNSPELQKILMESQRDSSTLNRSTGKFDKLAPFGRVWLRLVINGELPANEQQLLERRLGIVLTEAARSRIGDDR